MGEGRVVPSSVASRWFLSAVTIEACGRRSSSRVSGISQPPAGWLGGLQVLAIENRYANENNIVRHTLSTWNLVQAYDGASAKFLDAAKATLGFTQSHMVEETDAEHGEMALYRSNNRKLGTVVINILGIVDLARASGSKEYDDLLELGNFTNSWPKTTDASLATTYPRATSTGARTTSFRVRLPRAHLPRRLLRR